MEIKGEGKGRHDRGTQETRAAMYGCGKTIRRDCIRLDTDFAISAAPF